MKAEGWERIYRERGDLRFRVLPKIRRLSAVFEEKKYQKILDLGCGTGKHSIFLAKRGFQVYATDIAGTGIEIARKKAGYQGLDIDFRQHDMKNIPFPDGFFDAVICIWVIYHGTIDDIKRTLNEIYRILTSDGMLVTDFLSTADSTCGIGRETERNTFLGDKTDEEDVPHHYVTREELNDLFPNFKHLKIHASSNSYKDERGESYTRKYYNVEATK